MPSRRELVQRFVLDTCADDYENLTVSIEGPVVRWGIECGLTIEKSEIVDALKELLGLGLVKAYHLHGDGRTDWAEEFQAMPTVEEMEDPSGAWFDLTVAGREVQMAEYQGWPFDIDGTLHKDWTPPVA